MSKLSRKAVALGLTVATAAWAAGSVLSVGATGLTEAQIQAILGMLQSFNVDQSVIANVQAVLSGQTPSGSGASSQPSSGSSSAYTFTKDLTLGSRGADVKELQKFLNSKGYLVAKSGAGSPGNETEYFGPATRAALAKFQAENNISPAAGYFGPKTRAVVNQMLASSGAGGAQTGGGASQTPLSGVVSVSPVSLQGGSLISGSAQNPVHTVRVSNGTASDVWVTGLVYKKVGVVSDANIINAYISVGNEILAQYLSLAGGTLTFSGNLVYIPAGQSKDITLRVDVQGASSGNTVAFNLDLVALSSGQVSGSLPINGPVFTVTTVSNPNLAQVSQFQYINVGNEVDAGTKDVQVSSQSLSIQNSPVKLLSVRYTITGSINLNTDIRNLVLKVDGNPVASVSAPDSSGKVYFDMPNGVVLNTGSHLFEVYADVMGTPNRQFKVEILRPYDVVGVDTQYNANINFGTPTTGSATQISVRQGTITVNLASDSPTGNVAKGQSNVTLLKAVFYAAGEAVRIKWLPFKLTFSGGVGSGNIDSQVRNIAIYDDAGNQVGTTINQLSSSGACGGSNASFSGSSVSCSFGSSQSNINYVIPANTTRVLSLKVDIQNTATSSYIKADLEPASSNNVEGQVSFQTGSTGAVNGSILTIAQSPFSASINSSVGSQTYVAGTSEARLGSFSLSASSAEGIKVSSLTFKVGEATSTFNNFKIQNLYVKVGNNKFGNTQSTVSTNGAQYTFSGNPFTIPAGGSVIVDVYADILSNTATGTYPQVIDLVGATAVGAVSNSTQSLGATPSGQNVVIAGAGTLTVGVDSANPPARQIVMGKSQVEVARFRFTADNNENIKITDLRVTASSTATTAPATFSNLNLYELGSTQSLGTGQALTSVTSGVYASDFHFANPLVVPKNSTKTYVLKADVADYSSSPTSHNKTYYFRIATTSDVTAIGVGSNQPATVTGAPATSNAQTVLRTKLVVSNFVPLGATSNRVRNAADDVASLTLQVDPEYSAEFVSLKLTFSGSAPTSTFGVQLLDSSNNVIATGSVASASTTLSISPARLITAGSSETFKIRIDSSNFNNQSQTSDAMSMQIKDAQDLAWKDQGGSTNLPLETTAVPLTVTVSYE